MKNYIDESLASGIIRPSTSPVGAVFLWGRKMALSVFRLTAVFQALINDVLRNLLKDFVFVYLDDIVIFSSNPKQHQVHVRTVLRLLENQLFVKAEKCEFNVTSVSILGFIFENGQYRTDLKIVQPVS